MPFSSSLQAYPALQDVLLGVFVEPLQLAGVVTQLDLAQLLQGEQGKFVSKARLYLSLQSEKVR